MIGANYATQQLKTRYVYSFVFRVQLRKGGSPDLIIVDVDEDYFNDSISNLRTSNGFQQVLLLNRYGEVFYYCLRGGFPGADRQFRLLLLHLR